MFVGALDPVIGSIAVAFVASGLGAAALIRGERIKAGVATGSADTANIAAATANVSAQTSLLVNALQKQVVKMDAQIAARDSTIDDLRVKWSECETNRLKDREITDSQLRERDVQIGKQEAEIGGLSEAVAYLRQRITEIGDERIP